MMIPVPMFTVFNDVLYVVPLPTDHPRRIDHVIDYFGAPPPHHTPVTRSQAH